MAKKKNGSQLKVNTAANTQKAPANTYKPDRNAPRFKLSPAMAQRVADTLRQQELRRMSPIQRQAIDVATKSGKPVAYIGGSGVNSAFNTSSGIAQPLPKGPQFTSTKPPKPPKEEPPKKPPTTYNPTPLTGSGGSGGGGVPNTPPRTDSPQNPGETSMPSFEQQLSISGIGSQLAGNASGFRRRQSRARQSGMTSRGTSQFKISGQTSRSSGLNIGI